VVNSISKGWTENWKRNSWKKSDDTLALNGDLWERLLDLISEQQWVSYNWVRGHNGLAENECSDKLSQMLINGENLLEDTDCMPKIR
jgi:ribonuclease HI